MNRKCYELQSQEMWLGNPIKLYFSTKKKADEYFQGNCIGCGIISKVRLIANNQRFYEGCSPVNATVEILGVHE